MENRSIVVAGNGHSLNQIVPGSILMDDYIIRVNNFFFEPQYYLGTRVDLAFMGGDPRVSRYMFETLYQYRKDYDLWRWSSHKPQIIKAGHRRFPKTFQPMQYRDQNTKDAVSELITKYKKQPTTGIYAILMAHALGAKNIILAGFDFYASSRRYSYELGRHYRDLMGQQSNNQGADMRLHNMDLDRDILQALVQQGGANFSTSTHSPLLEDLMVMAPEREGQAIVPLDRESPPTDWVSYSGLYPISALKALRKGSTFIRNIKKTKLG